MPNLIDLTGKKFGKLYVVKHCGGSIWECRCDCGVTKLIKGQALREGKVISCGCNKRKDLVEQRFGRLLVLKRLGFINKKTYYECKCDCGKIVNVISSNLQKGTSNSCGCLANELTSLRSRTHNMSKTRLYNIWEGIKQRCYNPKVKAFKYYGKNNIQVCKEWFEFETFMQWAITNGYNDTLTIDRIDVFGNYCPENCRWVDKTTQANNTRVNVFLTVDGETNTIANWSKKTGINAETISWRRKHGWTDEECIKLKPNKSRKNYR